MQAAAIEAARANVEHHYAYICTHFQTFMDRWAQGLLRQRFGCTIPAVACTPVAVALIPACMPCRYAEQRRTHAEVLGRFEADMEALGAVEIAPQAASAQLRTLLHLVPEQRVRDWAAQCAASHQHLSDKVSIPCLSLMWLCVAPRGSIIVVGICSFDLSVRCPH